ncbi:MAG: nitroreductase family protein [Flavobacteriales bacterium]|nr:nitroreductase family protein [Flavobacteriales bacterium]
MENKYLEIPAIKAILSRKSVRRYTESQVEDQKIETLLRCGMAAPSGKNIQPWELIVVKDREKLNAMAEALPYAKMLSEAPMAIIVCADINACDYWYVDASAVTENILIAAEALGLGAVWTATYPYPERMDVVKNVFALPENVASLCVIPVGYPAKDYQPRDKFKTEKIHVDKY